jgi:glutamate formiminotransferase/formiminotetrahydrofolate cyclodeaminase
MSRLVECVPNFSEGRDKDKVAQICQALASVRGVTLLDVESDPDHNRSVVTLVGEPEALVESAFLGAKTARDLIDLNRHRGAHPRMGATDVIPFIPVKNVGMETCISAAQDLGRRMGELLEIPVFLYEQAATRPERQDLANERQGEFEGLKELIGKDPARSPDFGPARIHPTAGATAVGARMFLVAYNINLATNRLEVAQRIAKALRFRTGGLRFVKALGFYLKERGIVQVSMNLLNYRESAVHRVFAMVKEEAARYGVAVLESEVVGLVPNEALVMAAEHTLQMCDTWSPRQILENRLEEARDDADVTIASFLDRLAAPTAAPGGGSAAASLVAHGAALVSMVCGLTHGKKAYAAHQETVSAARLRSEAMRKKATELVEKDAAAFTKLMEAFRLPKEPDERAAERLAAIKAATAVAVGVPLEVMELAAAVAEPARWPPPSPI